MGRYGAGAGLALAFVMLGGASAVAEPAALTPVEELGRSIFFDANLSLNGNQPCAVCHSPEAGFTGPIEHLNEAGGIYEGSILGVFANRKPPTNAYAMPLPVLHHVFEGDDLLFVGGAFFDGRATGKAVGTPLADQAQGPFLNPLEMALPDAACVVARVCEPAVPALYPVAMTEVWGGTVCDIDLPADLDAQCRQADAEILLDEEARARVDAAFDAVARSLAAYQGSAEVSPYSSKFDAVMAGKADLTEQEAFGLEVFQGQGLCAECHVLDPGPNGEPPLFTDFTYDNLGIPRNPSNPWYTQPVNPEGADWVDPGLAGYLETDPIYAAVAAEQAGKHKVPTLRNVDRRPYPEFVKAFTHNGYFTTLYGVVHFYNTRDVKPVCPSPMTSEAQAMEQGCWPEPEVAANVNTDELGDLGLSAEQEWALVAFMRTLSDGYDPAAQ